MIERGSAGGLRTTTSSCDASRLRGNALIRVTDALAQLVASSPSHRLRSEMERGAVDGALGDSLEGKDAVYRYQDREHADGDRRGSVTATGWSGGVMPYFDADAARRNEPDASARFWRARTLHDQERAEYDRQTQVWWTTKRPRYRRLRTGWGLLLTLLCLVLLAGGFGVLSIVAIEACQENINYCGKLVPTDDGRLFASLAILGLLVVEVALFVALMRTARAAREVGPPEPPRSSQPDTRNYFWQNYWVQTAEDRERLRREQEQQRQQRTYTATGAGDRLQNQQRPR